jgi:hypothetical protein
VVAGNRLIRSLQARIWIRVTLRDGLGDTIGPQVFHAADGRETLGTAMWDRLGGSQPCAACGVPMPARRPCGTA